jgi:hypothetical protein
VQRPCGAPGSRHRLPAGQGHPYGGQGDHILIGCSRVAGALHSDDRLGGRTSIGTMAEDYALGLCRPYAIDLRLRVPGGTRF